MAYFLKPDAPNLRLEVDRFGKTGAEVEAGTSYKYSNAGFNTLGALVANKKKAIKTQRKHK